jgi:hypothetical protein
MKFRKRPVEVEAVQWTGTNASWDSILNMGRAKIEPGEMGSYTIIVVTLEGNMTARKGDWIIKGVKGELYPCKPDIFEMTYEAV